jgi:hypothetical protein
LLQRLVGVTFLAQHHEIVGVGHDTTAEALLQPELVPSRYETGACIYSPATVKFSIEISVRTPLAAARECAGIRNLGDRAVT